MAGPFDLTPAPDTSRFAERARAYLDASARFAREAADGDVADLAAQAGAIVAQALADRRTVMFCGNGGSAADAQHLAAELVGRLSRDRQPLAGLALTTDTSALTALGNDFGYDSVFERQVRALGREGDVLVAITTSGSSANVLKACDAARGVGVKVVALVGPKPSPLDLLADVCIHLPGETTGQVQQGHITVGHLICSLAETAYLHD